MQKPKLSFWQIWNMSFGFLGIQFGFALQNANVSRIFQSLGADVDSIPILWVAAPATGLVVQPIIGYLSDRTWSPKWGRRRPFFLIGAILSSVALIIMPNSPTWMIAAGMLWMLDASINISMEPFRAFVGDNLPNEQRTSGFAMQSFFIGIGAVVASALPWMMTNWLGISNEPAPGEQIPSNVYWSFYIGAVVFLAAVLWTVFKSFEYSPEEIENFDKEGSEEYKAEIDAETASKMQKRQIRVGFALITLGLLLSVWLGSQDLPKDLYIFSYGIAIAGLVAVVSGFLQKSGKSGGAFTTIVNDFQLMPKTMKQLAVVQFFSWFALFAMWIYTTNGVTATVYDMTLDQEAIVELKGSVEKEQIVNEELKEKTEAVKIMLSNLALADGAVTVDLKIADFFSSPDYLSAASVSDITLEKLDRVKKEYNEGADWVGVCFAVYNGFAAIFAFFLVWLAKRTSRKMTHFISLLAGGLGFISIFFIRDPDMLILSFVGIGLAWASILSMPYAILSGSIPSDKMGYYMGVFNFFIVIPQLVAAALLGTLVGYLFNKESIYALLIGGASMILAGLLTLLVNDRDDVSELNS